MRERHPFGLAGAARRVLNQRQVGGAWSGQGSPGYACEGFGDHDVAQAVDVRAQQVSEADRLGDGHQQRGSGIVEDAGVAT